MSEDHAIISEAIPDALDGERIDRAISFMTGASRSIVSKCIQEGQVFCNRIRVRKNSEKVATGDIILVRSNLLTDAIEINPEPEIVVPIIHVEEEFIVVDKPAGLVVHPATNRRSGTMVNGLLSMYPEIADVGDLGRPGIVHRLDKGTSGLLVVARSQLSHTHLTGQLQARTIARTYLALVCGGLDADKGIIDAPLGRDPKNPIRRAVVANGKEARTHYAVKERFSLPNSCCLVQCELETGRTHQIRAHFAAIGHPIVGDSLYRGSIETIALNRPFLHSSSLAFSHPETGERLEFTSEIPQELAEIMKRVS